MYTKDANTEELNGERYGWYLARVNDCRDMARRNSDSLDKLIFTLASGAIILSINFIDKITTGTKTLNLACLRWSWIFLFLTIISNLLSFICANQALNKQKQVYDIWFKSGTLETPPIKNIYSTATDVFNVSSYITLLVGLGLMTYFVSTNILILK